jgi:gamma-butyrobetaine dioxygenase
MSATMSPVDRIAELFAAQGAADYLGEPITLGAHMLQAGALAVAAGAPPALTAAALLHDVGHLRGADPLEDETELSGRELMAGTDNDHGERGAAWLAQWFPPAVTEPVRQHVAAKRYLCAAEPGYFGLLSPASVYTLSLQGGPMSAAEAAAFAAGRYAEGAMAIRRWDDAAKDPAADVPGISWYRPLLTELLDG